MFETSHPWAVDQATIHDENFEETFLYGPDHLFDEFIEDGALMPPTGNHAGPHHKKEVQLAVDVDQAHQLVAAVLLIPLVAEIHRAGFHGVVVLVNPKQLRL